MYKMFSISKIYTSIRRYSNILMVSRLTQGRLQIFFMVGGSDFGIVTDQQVSIRTY